MHRSLRLLLFITLSLLITCGNGSPLAQGDDVTIGDEPQQTEDDYMTDPSEYSVEVWVQDLVIPWSLVFLPGSDALVRIDLE